MACGAVVFWPGELFQAPLKYYKIQPLRSTMYIVTHIWFFYCSLIAPGEVFQGLRFIFTQNFFSLICGSYVFT